MRYSQLARSVVLVFFFVCPAFAQVNWTSFHQRSGAGGAYDTNRNVQIVFGGTRNMGLLNDTWEREKGGLWEEKIATSGRPEARADHAMVYVNSSAKAILFGGRTKSGPIAEAWHWDGNSWGRITPRVKPEPRFGHAMVYDSKRNRIIMFGGEGLDKNGRKLFADTWELRGTGTNLSWWKLPTPKSPDARSYHAMAYDETRDVVLLFGGEGLDQNGRKLFADTWKWDGSSWSKDPSTSGGPPARSRHAMAFHKPSIGVLMVGGGITNNATTFTWEWNGTKWNNKGTFSQNYETIVDFTLVHDLNRNVTVLSGGIKPLVITRNYDTTEWDGTGWKVPPALKLPPPRRHHSVAYDSFRKRVILVGGEIFMPAPAGDTWEFDGVGWKERQNVSSPLVSLAGMTFDAGRGVTVMFGGLGWLPMSLLDDTWEWNGVAWNKLSPKPQPRPSPRMSPQLLYDTRGKRVLLFGEGGFGTTLTDVWAWNGKSWSKLFDTVKWLGSGTYVAYDSHRNLIVSHGSGGTWEWDGATPATQKNSSSSPQIVSMTYDSVRRRVVAYGADPQAQGSSAVWEWVGNTWTQRKTSQSPPFRRSPVVFLEVTEEIFLFGGNHSGAIYNNDVWLYGPENPARYSTFGLGCAGAAGTPALVPRDRPWLGQTFVIDVQNIPPGAAGFMVLGASNSTWNGSPLPLPLKGIGMSGCYLRVSRDLDFPLVKGSWTVSIPSLPSVVGTQFYNQAAVLDSTANPLGVIVTDGGEGIVGSK